MRLDVERKGEGTDLPTLLVSEDVLLRVTGWKSMKDVRKKWPKRKLKGTGLGTASLSLARKDEKVVATNVWGVLPGTDSLLSSEIVALTSHYDHVGIDAEGLIYNGADDDGSGTVSLLENAEAWTLAAQAGAGPRRTMLFMAFVGEEKGLLGSEWYADHPAFPMDKHVCDLNMDMVGRFDEAHLDDDRYVYLIGSDKLSSELHEISEAVNSEHVGLALDYTFNAPDDPNRFYYRSDHYNFAKNGVPVIFYFSGVHEDYHGPGDTPDKIRYPKMAEIGRLVFLTSWEVANRDKKLSVDRVNDFPSDR
jgi:Zn-dependent M28 family amino/carboxypeptidase